MTSKCLPISSGDWVLCIREDKELGIGKYKEPGPIAGRVYGVSKYVDNGLDLPYLELNEYPNRKFHRMAFAKILVGVPYDHNSI